MELQFKKVGKRWVAEFEATGNFNLNIERVAPEKIQVFQKGAEDGEYASQASWYNNYASAIVDYDFSALIYPKWIKVVSYSEPVQAIVTMDSESGGSGSGGGLRPITADDVTLKITTSFGGQEVSFSNTIVVPQNNGFSIKIKDNKKSLFFTGETAVRLISFEGGELYSTSDFNTETTINLEDIYIKD